MTSSLPGTTFGERCRAGSDGGEGRFADQDRDRHGDRRVTLQRLDVTGHGVAHDSGVVAEGVGEGLDRRDERRRQHLIDHLRREPDRFEREVAKRTEPITVGREGVEPGDVVLGDRRTRVVDDERRLERSDRGDRHSGERGLEREDRA